MPTLVQSDAAKGIETIPYPAYAGHVVAKRFSVTVPATAAANDIFEIAPLPAGCVPIDLIIDSDDLDSNGSATIAVDVGVMSGAWETNDSSRTVGNEFLDGDTVAQAGGSVRPSAKTAFRVSATDTDRSIGMKIATVAATKQAGEFGVTVFYATR